MAVTDSKGRFRLLGVAPGKIDLEAYAPDVGRGNVRAVEVSGGRPTSGVKIRLIAGEADDDPAAAASLAITLGERGSGNQVDIVVVHVAAGSEAERSGIRSGDVVVAVDGVAVASMSDARSRLSGPNGSDVIVELDRDGAPLRLRVAREAVRR
jgi:S1-C subfamily serine protease